MSSSRTSATTCPRAPSANPEPAAGLLTVKFGRFDIARLPELTAWFATADELLTWGGPEFRFPFTTVSFREDAKVDSIDSFSLVAEDGSLAAFGQCYLRIERCHFGRVGVAPARRGQGLGTRLLREMAGWGQARFGPRELSLFVLRGNTAAHRLYRRLGFRETPYPDPAILPDAHYLIADRIGES
jgi:ribosomal protein S18 acetylase RimI-like enzyme